MKATYLSLCALLFAFGLMAQSSGPNAKVSEAYSAQELSMMSALEIETLNAKAEYLCWFEAPKSVSKENFFQLHYRNGSPATLTPDQIANFNPLLYQLDQETLQCRNLLIQATDGSAHLLVVRSIDMFNKQMERNKIKANKAAKK